jgi:hypothetical protein
MKPVLDEHGDESQEPLRADGTPIPTYSPDSPYRAGEAHYDAADDVTYRVVSGLRVSEGWGTAAFWLARWDCSYELLLHFAKCGWIDAAISAGTSVKRFRCRDEVRCLRYLEADALAARMREASRVADARTQREEQPQTRTKKKRKGLFR